MMELNLEKKMW